MSPHSGRALILCAVTLLISAPHGTSNAETARLPLEKTNFAVAIGGLDAASTTNWVRLGQYTFAADGTVSAQDWYWSQRIRVRRASTGVPAENCAGRDCTVLTAAGWQTTETAQEQRGTYTVANDSLNVTWTDGQHEDWKISSLAGGKLSGIELTGNNFGATLGFGNGSNAPWTARVPATVIAAAQHAELVHRYYLWKTRYSPETGYTGYIDHGDGAPFWVRKWNRCDGDQCLGAQTTSNAGATHTAYYISPADAPAGHRRDALWHWHIELADARNEDCYTGNSHVKPMIQVVDDDGGFHGWVGVEASLNQSTKAGVNDDDIGIFRIVG